MWREDSHTSEVRCRGIGWLGVSNLSKHVVFHFARSTAGCVRSLRLSHVWRSNIRNRVACWLAREDSASTAPRGLIAAMVFYDFVFVALLLAARFVGGLSGLALWPTVVFHLGWPVLSQAGLSCSWGIRRCWAVYPGTGWHSIGVGNLGPAIPGRFAEEVLCNETRL
jgi:hypothetical protein